MGKYMATAAVILAGFLSLLYFQGLTDSAAEDPDPVSKVRIMEKDLINGYGLERNQALSRVQIAEVDDVICYEDRLVRHFRYEEEQAGVFGGTIKKLRELCPGIGEVYVVPVPERVLVEPGFDEDAVRYERFMGQLEKTLEKTAVVADPWSVLSEHTDEYIFFRTETGWTARGAYYGSAALCGQMGIRPLSLAAYEEHMYMGFTGTLCVNIYQGLYGDKAVEKLNELDGDACFYYILPGRENREFLIAEDGSSSTAPIYSHSRSGRAAFLGDTFYCAVIPGAGKEKEMEEETVLFLCDNTGKILAPFMADYCKTLYVINMTGDKDIVEMMPGIVKEHGIRKLVISQLAGDMGISSRSAAIRSLME